MPANPKNLRLTPDDRVLVLTGAGISAESGIPTFRGPDGYWRKLDPTKLATREAFERDPALVWEWYRERQRLISAARPNAAHAAVVRLGLHCRDFLLLTQNVDDLHARATWQGRSLAPSQQVQIHGSIFASRCFRCDRVAPSVTPTQNTPAPAVPLCSACHAPLRPGVVWFDEELPGAEVTRVENFLAAGTSMLVLVIGTNASFDYIVHWARRAAGPHGHLIELNPAETPLSRHATATVREPAAVALPALVESWLA